MKGVTLDGVGHLIPMEASEKTAEVMAEWLEGEVSRFRDELKWQEDWTAKSLKEKQDTDETWKRMIGGPLQRNSKI